MSDPGTRRLRDAREVDYGELPELTRGLRALGSAKGGGTALQTQFFSPLMEARRRAAEARSAALCLDAFDSASLTRALDRAVDAIVSAWPDNRPAVRRALRAELQERAAPYRATLNELDTWARRALAADEPERLEAWRDWTVRLAATFEAADRCWMALRSAVGAVPERGTGKGEPGTV